MNTEQKYPSWMSNPLMQRIYSYLANYDNAEIEADRIIVHALRRMGTVNFYEYEATGIVELSVDSTRTGENLFYLHFEPINEADTREAFLSFVDVLECKCPAVQKIEKAITNCKRVLLVCTSGVTSGFFAQRMQQVLQEDGSDIRVEAAALSELDSICIPCYDKILLTPQVGYQIQDISRRFGAKVSKINPLDFATMNARKVVYEMLA